MKENKIHLEIIKDETKLNTKQSLFQLLEKISSLKQSWKNLFESVILNH